MSMSPRPMERPAPLVSMMVRESICEATWKAMREGRLALMMPVTTLTDGRWVAMMMRDGRRASWRGATFVSISWRDHQEIGELVDDDHDIRHVVRHPDAAVHGQGIQAKSAPWALAGGVSALAPFFRLLKPMMLRTLTFPKIW